MRRLRKKISDILPEYSFFPLILAFLFNMAVYIGARLIAGNWKHYNIETPLDRKIPFWPPSVLIYLGCYLFWAVNYILIARQSKEKICQFFSGDFLSRVICFAFFLLFPTTNTRPEVSPDGLWNRLMQFLYSVDAPDNLFPSIHCLVSWLCYIGIRGKKEYPLFYRAFSCVMALLVCLSTLTTKQHVIADVIAGIVLAELCFFLGKQPNVYRPYEKLLDKITGILRKKGEKQDEYKR
jgi:membrane-associated phospholipid phosphatase